MRVKILGAAGLLLVLSAVCMLPSVQRGVLRLVGRALPAVDGAAYLQPNPSPVLLDRNERILGAFLNEKEQWSFPIPLEKIQPQLIAATLAAEDKRFYSHGGIDVYAVLRAAWANLRYGGVVSGASTLTMQVVKPLLSQRGFLGKLEQAGAALALEQKTDKRSILEAYLNQAPYGGNLVGVEAASRRYFGKSASELTLDEAALVAGLPKSPTHMNPFTAPERALARRNIVLRRMADEGFISEAERIRSTERPLSVAWHDMDILAPHSAQRLRKRVMNEGVLQLTLDAPLQRRLETMLQEHLRQFDHTINNGAIMVVDTQSREILARVGSADFYNADIQGQVDVCHAVRAPGSALKPFIYALAMERQQLYPTEAFLDRPLDYGFYNPQNFDGDFNGLVSAGEALRWSLNVPAVQILDRVGIDPALTLFHDLGFTTLNKDSEHYGLGLVLGNCEVSLERLVNAYLTLAHLGVAQDAVLIKGDDQSPPRSLLSEEVTLALWNMLEQPFPDDPWIDLVRTNDKRPRICWKTGTSSGYHDAWAVVFNAHYVVGVWMGNTDGRSAPSLIGAQSALPLAARIVRSLPLPMESAWPEKADRLVSVDVCAATGLPASAHCPVTTKAMFPANQYLHRRCDVHRPRPEGGGTEVHWPADARHWNLANVQDSQGTYGETKSTDTARHQKLAIKSPTQNATYVLSGEEGHDRIRLEANLERDTLQWYVNGRYLGASDYAAPLFMDLVPGEQELSCMNSAGDTARVCFVVEAS